MHRWPVLPSTRDCLIDSAGTCSCYDRQMGTSSKMIVPPRLLRIGAESHSPQNLRKPRRSLFGSQRHVHSLPRPASGPHDLPPLRKVVHSVVQTLAITSSSLDVHTRIFRMENRTQMIKVCFFCSASVISRYPFAWIRTMDSRPSLSVHT